MPRIFVRLPDQTFGEIDLDDDSYQRIDTAVRQSAAFREAKEAAERVASAFRDFGATFTVFGASNWGNRTGSSRYYFDEFVHNTPAEPTPEPKPKRPRTPFTQTEALAVVKHYAGDLGHGQAALRTAVRRAKRKTHPDTGGTAADFQLVTAAEDILRRARTI